MKADCIPSISLILYITHAAQTEEDKYLITLVYRFVFANEAICGDPFGDPEWLPAAEQCFVNCDPAVHMCMIHTKTSAQKCRAFSRECQNAIRKHLGWSSTIVSIYRPESTTMFMPAFVTSPPDSHADRSAVAAAEDIERDFVGPDPLPAPAFSNDIESTSSPSFDLTTPIPTQKDWNEVPAAQDNGYSVEEVQPSLSTLGGYDVPADRLSEYDSAGMNNNIEYVCFDIVCYNAQLVLRQNVEEEVDSTQEDSDPDYVPITLSPMRTTNVLYTNKPEPSPPAFPPYYLEKGPTSPIPMTKTQPEDIVPRYINFLEPPGEDLEEADGYGSLPPPHPPGFNPTASVNQLNNELGSQANFDNGIMQREQATPSADFLVPFSSMQKTADENGIEEPIILSGNTENGEGTRFEVSPPHSPLRSASNVGTFDADLQSLQTFPERRIQQFTDPNSHRKIIADIQPEKARDHSKRCCEWSLNGLCDSHWQRVRLLCAKSCGTLVCEEIEGIKSCTRVVDVDVEDCFHSTRIARYFGLKNAETDEERRSVIDGIVQQKLGRNKRRKYKKRRH
ncbi:unnamed protein product [Cylicocyclus nassatus]|uniref:Uncharacterized protein n=1 Tax=Cylicocyclus nassatus TaxID=53992 RepID=A0AA36HF60_CYLNA|nr:unnamed protein product [Cylicocyclus nassatus]